MESAQNAPNIFVIDPSQYPRDSVYTRFIWLWGILVLIMGGLCYYHDAMFGAILAGLMLVAIVPLMFFTRMQIDIVEIKGGEIMIRRLNPVQEVVRFPQSTSLEVSLEKYGRSRGQTRSPEAVWSLNIWDHQLGFQRRTMLALRVAPASKEQIYLQLIDFLKGHGIDVSTYNEGNLS